MQNLPPSEIEIDYINQKKESSLKTFIENCEKAYQNQIEDMINDIISLPKIKIILLTGPSSSGKTTTSNKIMQLLKNHDIPSVVVSMDDFFIDRDKTPMFEDGTYDFENVNSLDIPFFNAFMKDILTHNKASMPIFDFVSGKRKGYKDIEIEKDGIVIIEGIHALNPIFQTNHDEEVYRVYVCPDTNFIKDNKTIIKPSELRRMRRLIRDRFHRGANTQSTLKQWKYVCEGEKLYIEPYKMNANYWVNTTHNYEPMLYKKYLPQFLDQSQTSNQIKESLCHFEEIDISNLPADSLLWEFLDGLKQ